MKKGGNNKKGKYPSRDRYEKETPTVSARVPKKTRDRLYANLAKLGMSLADALKVIADELEIKVRPVDEVREQGYDDGLEKGITLTVEMYMVTYPCSGCGKPIELDSPEEKAAAGRYMREHGWGHRDCINRRR